MADLVLRPSTLVEGKPWALQLRYHDCVGPTDYHTLTRVTDETARVIVDAGAAFFLFGDPPEKPSPVLSEWAGWDQSNMPWSQAQHQDAVCAAVFGPTWSMEDAAALIGFIDKTWRTSKKSKSAEPRNHADVERYDGIN